MSKQVKFSKLCKNEETGKPYISPASGEMVTVMGFRMFYQAGQGLVVNGYIADTVITEAQSGQAIYWTTRYLDLETAISNAKAKIRERGGIRLIQKGIKQAKAFCRENGLPFPVNPIDEPGTPEPVSEKPTDVIEL